MLVPSENLTPVQRAYLEWQALAPFDEWIERRQLTRLDGKGNTVAFIEPGHWDGKCCTQQHTSRDAFGANRELPDDQVCLRERAWRKYIRLRGTVDVTQKKRKDRA